MAIAAVEHMLGSERLVSAVDHYVAARPGSELARSVLWLLHPWSAMLRCRELFASSRDLDVRRSAIELLRVVADARVLPWIEDFLADPDEEIQAWGILIVDQLLFAGLSDHDACEPILVRARSHANKRVRETVWNIDEQADAQE